MKKVLSVLLAMMIIAAFFTMTTVTAFAADEDPDVPDDMLYVGDIDDDDEEPEDDYDYEDPDYDDEGEDGLVPCLLEIWAVGQGEASCDPEIYTYGSAACDTLTLTATEKGGKFIEWSIEGRYEIVSGSLYDKVLVIRPSTLSYIFATAYFEEAEGGKPYHGECKPVYGDLDDKPCKKPAECKTDDSKTSPKTGDMSYIVIGMMLIAAAMGAFAVKKIRE